MLQEKMSLGRPSNNQYICSSDKQFQNITLRYLGLSNEKIVCLFSCLIIIMDKRKDFIFFNISSDDKQLKKWQCHFVCLLSCLSPHVFCCILQLVQFATYTIFNSCNLHNMCNLQQVISATHAIWNTCNLLIFVTVC